MVVVTGMPVASTNWRNSPAASAVDDAAAAVKHRALGFFDEADDFVEDEVIGAFVGIVAGEIDRGGPLGMGLGLLQIFREIDHHRAGPAGAGDVNGLFHDARDFVDVGDQITMFDNRQGHAEEVGFLEAALADHGLRDLAGDGDQGDGIHIGVGDGGDEIGGAGAAGGHADAGLASGARVTLRGEGAALLVARENGADGGTRQGLVNLHAGAAGIGEHDIDALAFERADKDVAAKHRGRNGLGRFGRLAGLFDFSVHRKKPTTVAGRGCIVESFFYARQDPPARSSDTTTTPATCSAIVNIGRTVMEHPMSVKRGFFNGKAARPPGCLRNALNSSACNLGTRALTG